uniref:Radial spoke protein 3 n=1 Tax=Salvator merianae TaxID=96440 RepID=A0A8D0E9T1_SALMN
MTSVILSQEASSIPTRTYSYSSRPRAVQIKKHYPRSTVTSDLEDGPVRYGNLMYDRRVVRGNTYAAQTLPWLFDFDLEVIPVVQVLVGKCIEQACLEVTEEEELANLHAHQIAYQELRNAEIAEMQRLEARERRHKEEKERRKAQQAETKLLQSAVSEKVGARAFALQYLSNLIPAVFNSLQRKGFYYDQILREVEHGFLPYVINGIDLRIEKRMLGRIMTDCKLIE